MPNKVLAEGYSNDEVARSWYYLGVIPAKEHGIRTVLSVCHASNPWAPWEL